MKNIFKKTIAAFLVVLMLISSIPLQGLVGVDFFDLFANDVNAAGANYAKKLGIVQSYSTIIEAILDGSDTYFEYVWKVTIDGNEYSIVKDLISLDYAEAIVDKIVVYSVTGDIVDSIKSLDDCSTVVNLHRGNSIEFVYESGSFNKQKLSLKGEFSNYVVAIEGYALLNDPVNNAIRDYFLAKDIHKLEDAYVTLTLPDTQKLYFIEGLFSDKQISKTIQLDTIDPGKSGDFKCNIYVNSDYCPTIDSENIPVKCSLNGYLNGEKFSKEYSGFFITIKKVAEQHEPVFGIMSLRDLLQDMYNNVNNCDVWEESREDNIKSGLEWDLLAAMSLNSNINGIYVKELLDLLIDLGELNAKLSKGQYSQATADAYMLIAESLADEITGVSDRLKDTLNQMLRQKLNTEEFGQFLKWYMSETGYRGGQTIKCTKECPIDITVTDDDENIVLSIINDTIVFCDSTVTAFVVDSKKIFYLPTGIEHKITTLATDDGTMDYSVSMYTPSGVERTIKYNDVPLVKDESYTALAPCEAMVPADTFNLLSENGEEIKYDSDTLPPVEDNIVDVIVAEEIFDGFPVEVIDLVADTMFNMKSVVDLSAYDISTDDAVALFSAIAKYYPVEYSLMSKSDFTYKIIVSPNLDRIMKIRFYYGDDAKLDVYQKRVKDLNAEIDALVAQVEGMNEFEKALYIHDYIVLNSEYDLEFLALKQSQDGYITNEQYQEKYSEYSILINGTGLCGSYALAYRAILNAAGMECLYLSSNQMNHAWNLVKINGNWYHVDCCWDDPTPDTYGRARRTYFLRTDKEIMELNHYSWTPGQYKATSEKYSDMPRNYDIKQKYDDGKWYYLNGSTLYSSDKYGKNEIEIGSMSASSIAVDDGNIYFTNGICIYEYDFETGERDIVYMLSSKDSGERISEAYISNMYIDDETVEFYKSIYKEEKRTTVYDTDILQREKFSSIFGVKISHAAADVNVFNTLQLNAEVVSTGSTEDLTFTWTTTDKKIASVDETGLVTANNVGTVTITATCLDYSTSCELTVTGDGLSGMCGDSAKWSVDKDTKTMTLFGSGEVTDAAWINLKDTIEHVVVENGITSLMNDIFKEHSNLITAKIADSVTKIGYSAFYNCVALNSVVLPANLTELNSSMFGNCSSLENIVIPEKVKTILPRAFQHCTKLSEIILPDSVTEIGVRAFYGCTSLKKIVFGASVFSMGNYATFYCDSLTAFEVSDENTRFSTDENGVLYNKDKTKLVRYPMGKTDSTYVLPATVKTIEKCAFCRAANLENIFADSDNVYFTSDENGILYNEDKTVLYRYPEGKKDKTFVVPVHVSELAYDAFYNCDNLINIYVPETVTAIDDSAFNEAGNLMKVLILNAECEMPSSLFLSVETFDTHTVVYGYSNSTAEKCAQKNKCQFVAIDTEPHTHDYFLMEYTELSATTDGYEYWECYCGEDSYTVTQHNYAEAVNVAPTCVADGAKKEVCVNCAAENILETYPATGEHNYQLVSTIPGNCTTAPVMNYKCADCEATTSKTGTIDDGHKYAETVIAPTCTQKGYTTATCSECEETVIYDFTSPLGHEFIINRSENYCEAHGTLEYSCKNCDYYEKIVSDKSMLVTETVTVEPTCTKSGTKSEICTLCGATVSTQILNPLSHEYEEDYTVDVDATCTTDGRKSQHCTRCDAKRAVTVIEQLGHKEEIIPAVAATCTATGLTQGLKCSECSEILVVQKETEKLTHSYNTVVTPPTCTRAGYTTYICECGSEYIETIAATGHKDSNGDAVCDSCSMSVCSHMCHKTGFMGFIWKIVQFFWKLFGMNPICECGTAHY